MLTVKEEYIGAFRTESYSEIWFKAQLHLETTRRRASRDYTHLLEPNQETLLALIDQTHLHGLFVDYFDTTLESCKLCGSLLDSLHQVRANHRIIQRLLKLTAGDCTQEQSRPTVSSLARYARLDNPLSGSSPVQFRRIHDLYGPIFQRLTSAHRKIVWRLRFVGLFRKVGASSLARLGAQADAAARGAFALDRDFGTMDRMVTRINVEIEHGRDVVKLFLRSNERERRLLWREMVREFETSEGWFVEQIAELEEHVYLCFLNINRVRRLVIGKVEDQQQL